MNEEEIIDGLKTICICKGIRKKVFLKLIAEGNTTIDQLRQKTGAGSGPCGGQRCTPRLKEMLAALPAGDTDS
ncbi:MAG: (2Fe-2S)-binding protein [Desulfuromonas sp.]|nr:MAG: (2Fe-2S)-binding protein [Desulfuromonas sp.]